MAELVQLIYISAPVGSVAESVRHFVPLAQEKNVQFNLTGMIISSEKFFLQVIEGNRRDLNQLYHNIVDDPRHADITLLRYADIRIREFPKWSMAHISVETLKEFVLNGIVLPEEIRTNTLSAPQAVALLRRTQSLLTVQQKISLQE